MQMVHGPFPPSFLAGRTSQIALQIVQMALPRRALGRRQLEATGPFLTREANCNDSTFAKELDC